MSGRGKEIRENLVSERQNGSTSRFCEQTPDFSQLEMEKDPWPCVWKRES